MNCGDISTRHFESIGNDPFRLDGDGDGVACAPDRPGATALQRARADRVVGIASITGFSSAGVRSCMWVVTRAPPIAAALRPFQAVRAALRTGPSLRFTRRPSGHASARRSPPTSRRSGLSPEDAS